MHLAAMTMFALNSLVNYGRTAEALQLESATTDRVINLLDWFSLSEIWGGTRLAKYDDLGYGTGLSSTCRHSST